MLCSARATQADMGAGIGGGSRQARTDTATISHPCMQQEGSFELSRKCEPKCDPRLLILGHQRRNLTPASHPPDQ